MIHYPRPPHLQEAYRDLGYAAGSMPATEVMADQILSLPIGPHLDALHAQYVVDAVLASA